MARGKFYQGTFEQRFLDKVQIIGESGCWIWMAGTMRNGYGTMYIKKLTFEGAHRVSWRLYRGEIPKGTSVLHRCDVRCCVNPDHLFLGTVLDNAHDMVAKGRSTKGERHPAAKITAEQAALIRFYPSEVPQRIIAAKFGISRSQVGKIRTGENW